MHGIRVGEVVRIEAARPSWWRVFALVRWWLKRGERKRPGFYRVTSVSECNLRIR